MRCYFGRLNKIENKSSSKFNRNIEKGIRKLNTNKFNDFKAIEYVVNMPYFTNYIDDLMYLKLFIMKDEVFESTCYTEILNILIKNKLNRRNLNKYRIIEKSIKKLDINKIECNSVLKNSYFPEFLYDRKLETAYILSVNV